MIYSGWCQPLKLISKGSAVSSQGNASISLSSNTANYNHAGLYGSLVQQLIVYLKGK